MSRTTTDTNNIAYDNICIVCYDPLDEEVGIETTKCGHKYCSGCYDEHMKIDNKCAMCRTVLKEKEQRRSSVIVTDGGTVTINLGPITNMGSVNGGLYARVGPATNQQPYSEGFFDIVAPYGNPRNILSVRDTAIELGWELDDGRPQTFDIGPPINYEPTGTMNWGPLHSRGVTGGVYPGIVAYEGDFIDTVTPDEPGTNEYTYVLEIDPSPRSTWFTSLAQVTVTPDEPSISMYSYRLNVNDSAPSGVTDIGRALTPNMFVYR
jgi:hypothetical protein